MDTLDYRPITIGDAIVDRSTLNLAIVQSLYSTLSWPNITTGFDMLINGNQDESFLRRVFQTDATMPDSELAMAQATMGIHCLDRAARAGTFEEVLPTVERLAKVSKVLGGVTFSTTMTCAQWKLQPKERYEGDFHVKTRNPVLIIGNTYDGLTPIRSAHNISSGFEGSVVLEVKGYGV